MRRWLGIGLPAVGRILAAVAAVLGLRPSTPFPAGRLDGTERIESSTSIVNS